MVSKYKLLDSMISKIEKELKQLPEGKLVLCFNGKNKYKWFRSDGHKKEYIKRENRALAEQLAYKKYLTLRLKELNHEKRAIESYLKRHRKEIPKSNQLISNSSEYQELLSSYFTPLDQELNNWMHADYEKNQSHPERLIHKTSTGEYVRSKSEAFILTYLHMNKIPFRYEAALQLGSTVVYPDFTIRHPDTGKIIYWEHCGLMDNRGYARNIYAKLDMYHLHGIIPSINLITTFETKNHPLSVEVIEKIIEHYFL